MRSIKTDRTPYDIVGRDNMEMFKKHLQVCLSGTNNGEFPENRLNKEIGQDARDRIKNTYEELRANGYYPDYINALGRVVFLVACKDKAFGVVEKYEPFGRPMPEHPTDEQAEWIRGKAREMFSKMINKGVCPQQLG